MGSSSGQRDIAEASADGSMPHGGTLPGKRSSSSMQEEHAQGEEDGVEAAAKRLDADEDDTSEEEQQQHREANIRALVAGDGQLVVCRAPLLSSLKVSDADQVLRRPFKSPHPNAQAGMSEVRWLGKAHCVVSWERAAMQTASRDVLRHIRNVLVSSCVGKVLDPPLICSCMSEGAAAADHAHASHRVSKFTFT